MFTTPVNFAILIALEIGIAIGWWLNRRSSRTATLSDLLLMEARLLMTQKELADALDKLTAQTGKVAKEQSDRFDSLSAEIKRLTEIINAGEVTPEVTAALGNVQSALDTLDQAIPDAPDE